MRETGEPVRKDWPTWKGKNLISAFGCLEMKDTFLFDCPIPLKSQNSPVNYP
jgi:hypothetical protein